MTELRTLSETSSAIRALLGLAPKTARRLDEQGGESDVLLDHVQVGDRLRDKPAVAFQEFRSRPLADLLCLRRHGLRRRCHFPQAASI